jgi:hypothetical protein
MMRDITTKEYADAIPKCCAYQTVEDHSDALGLCWGLASALKSGIEMDCSGCEFNTLDEKYRK